MSVSDVNALSIITLTVLSIIYQWLYKIVYMSIYTIDIKIILKKERIGEKGRYLDTLTNLLNSLVSRVLVSIYILTNLLTTDKKGARFGYYLIKYILEHQSTVTLPSIQGNPILSHQQGARY